MRRGCLGRHATELVAEADLFGVGGGVRLEHDARRKKHLTGGPGQSATQRGRTRWCGWAIGVAGPALLLAGPRSEKRSAGREWAGAEEKIGRPVREQLGRGSGTGGEREKRGRPTGPKTGKGERREENSFFLF